MNFSLCNHTTYVESSLDYSVMFFDIYTNSQRLEDFLKHTKKT